MSDVPKELLNPCIIWVLYHADRELTTEEIAERVGAMTTDQINEARAMEAASG